MPRKRRRADTPVRPYKVWAPEMCDVYLNDKAYDKNVPVAVWEYYIGGYQVVKKWLSYRDKSMLGRCLKMEEAEYVTEMIRRITAILMTGDELDANYKRVKEDTYEWGKAE